MEQSAITLVYFRESRRRRNESGITISLQGSAGFILWGVEVVEHECSDPELPVNQKRHAQARCKSLDQPRHQITNDDKIADGDAEAFDGNGGIKENREIWVGQLGERSKRYMAAVHISGASSLQV